MGRFGPRLQQVLDEVSRSCDLVGRDPGGVTLVAVSKSVGIEAMQEAYGCGQRHFGESRWQELRAKQAAMPADVVWHFIGRLQSNKARAVAGSGCLVHSLDSPSHLAQIEKQPRMVQAFIEVNVAEEAQKSGVSLTTLDSFARLVAQCSRVDCIGLMTIGPVCASPEQNRLVFRQLAVSAKALGLPNLSMGMSSDYGVAVQEGATHIRVGSALFGG